MPVKSKNKGKQSDVQPKSSSKSSKPARKSNSQNFLLETDFIPIPSSVSLHESPFTFSIASWNILADSHVFGHYYPQRKPHELKWNFRYPQLLGRIHSADPDILCMQEVDHWNQFDDELKKQGYINLYKPRGGDKMDGCSISFKNEKFELIDRLEISFDDLTQFSSKHGMDETRERKHCVALGCVLRPKITNLQNQNHSENHFDFLVLTTHLFWNSKYEDVKLRQALYLMYQLKMFVGIGPKDDQQNSNCSSSNISSPTPMESNVQRQLPIIICGDFNSTPDSALGWFLRSGNVNLSNWEKNQIFGRSKGRCDGLSIFGLDHSNNPSSSNNISSNTTDGNCKEDESIDSFENLSLYLKSPFMRHPFEFQSAYENYEILLSDQSNYKPINANSNAKGKEGNHSEVVDDFAAGEPTTSHFKQFSGTLDYIFFSTSSIFQLESLLRIPTKSEIESIGFLPTETFASDHVMIMANMNLIDINNRNSMDHASKASKNGKQKQVPSSSSTASVSSAETSSS